MRSAESGDGFQEHILSLEAPGGTDDPDSHDLGRRPLDAGEEIEVGHRTIRSKFGKIDSVVQDAWREMPVACRGNV